jgi:hypothetical protein
MGSRGIGERTDGQSDTEAPGVQACGRGAGGWKEAAGEGPGEGTDAIYTTDTTDITGTMVDPRGASGNPMQLMQDLGPVPFTPAIGDPALLDPEDVDPGEQHRLAVGRKPAVTCLAGA